MRLVYAALLYLSSVAMLYASPLGDMVFYGSVSAADMLEAAVTIPALGMVMVPEGWPVLAPLLAGCVLGALAVAYWRRPYAWVLLSAALFGAQIAGLAGVAIMGSV